MENYDYCILGAGLAGLSLAKKLIDSSESNIIIIEPNKVGGGASGTPIGLANPATGRFANKSWRTENSLRILEKNFKDVEQYSKKKFYSKSGVIRPAMDKKIASRMKDNLNSSNWLEGWCYWIDENEIENRFPGLSCVEGGAMVNQAFTVDVPEYLNALTKYLRERGVQIVSGKKYALEKSYGTSLQNWKLLVDSEESITASKLIFTSGVKTASIAFWRDLPLIPVKGQLATFKLKEEFPYDLSVSALGYFASLYPFELASGSTYEHKFDYDEPDERGLNYITDRLLRVIPDLKNKIEFNSQWSGVRASTPDRMPIVGKHGDENNIYVIAGLGSKGLLYGGLLAEELVNHLISDYKISKEIAIKRFS